LKNDMDADCASRHQQVRILMEVGVTLRLKRMMAICLVLVMPSWTLIARSQSDARQAAFLLEQQGKTVEAEAAWIALSKTRPTDPEPLAHLGLLEAHQEHYAEAITSYRKAMALNPTMPRLQFNLGLAYFKTGDYKEALQQFKPLLKTLPPESDEAQRLVILIGMSHYGLGEFAASTPYLKQAADRDAQNQTLLLTLAHSCLLSRQYQCVLDAFHRMVALNAESAESDMLVGEALDEMKDTIGATKEFRAAIAANPKEPNVHFGLGYLLWTQGHSNEAAGEFQAELANDPEHIQAMLYLADSQIQMNRMDAARPLLEKVAKTDPANPMGHLDLGIVYAEAGRNEEAVRELKVAAELNPNDANAHWRLSRLYRSVGKAAEANAELAKTKRIDKASREGLVNVMSRVSKQSSVEKRANGTATEK
jgi:tetratricopeptide (TPR) repeat protein